MQVTAIDHVNLSFPRDRLDEVVEFYVETLGFATGFDDPRAAVADDPGLFPVFLGDGARLYVSPTDSFDPAASNYNHVAVQVPESPAALRAFLDDASVEVDHVAERDREYLGEYTSYYVVDPFGYTIELMAVGA